MENEKKTNIGGCWIKTSKAGNKFMSGTIEIEGVRHQFVVFKNKHKKEGSNHPDYVIFPSNPIPAENKEKTVHPAIKAITDSFADVPDGEITF